MLVAVCLTVLLAALAVEACALAQARKAVPLRIHVNGTRGKSTVTRLIWAALLHAGIPALGKTTGTEARFLLPDGSEEPVPRRGRASIREQIRTLLTARRRGARALVVECMAVQPELQWVSEQHILRSTIGVVTNVRLDHTEAMGGTIDEIAASLSNTVPRNGILILGETRSEAIFAARAEALGCRVVTASSGEVGWLEAGRAVALAVTREIGIDDAAALEGMSRTAPDPGWAAGGCAHGDGREWNWFDARAANDPESLSRLLREQSADFTRSNTLTIFNHRGDRSQRLLDFAGACFGRERAGPVWVTGDRPPWLLWRTARRMHGTGMRYVPPSSLRAELRDAPPGTSAVVFCGNTRGLSIQAAFSQVDHG